MKIMKKSILLTGLALMLSAALMAQAQTRAQSGTRNQQQVQVQSQEQVQNQPQVQSQDRLRNQTQDQRRQRIQDPSTHGQQVSETARTTESGPGKGEVVKEVAKNQGEAQQLQNQNKISAKNQKGNINRNARSNTARNAMKVQKSAGTGRK